MRWVIATEGGRVFLGRAVTLSKGNLRLILVDADEVVGVVAAEVLVLVLVLVVLLTLLTAIISLLPLADAVVCGNQKQVRQKIN